KERALLMLFLLSDVGVNDAPTRIRVGSHFQIARELAPAGEDGLSLRELSVNGYSSTAHLSEVHATGEAGTVYLCHPFLVHRAEPPCGPRPKLLARPGLPLPPPLVFDRPDGDHSAVETAVRRALGPSPVG